MSASRRIFFGLWPDDSVRLRLAALQRRLIASGCPGRAVRSGGLHLTLAFVGDVTPEMLACCRESAGAVAGTPFPLRLDTLGSFPRTRIAWVGPATVPDALSDLARRLNSTLASNCGFTPEDRPYRPHITLLRDGCHPHTVGPINTIEWPVTRFCLFESRPGVPYEILREYPLGG